MKIQKMAIAALASVALVGTTLTLTLNSNAQLADPPGQGPGAGPRGGQGFGTNPPPGVPGQPGQGQFRPQGGFGGGGGGGGTAMDSDNSFLYIVQGNMLFKVAKNDLKVLGSTPLMQMPQGREGGRGDFARPGQGAPPPPPETAK